MVMATLTILRPERLVLPPPIIAPDEDTPDEDDPRRRFDPAPHALAMAQATRRVIAAIALPPAMPHAQRVLTGLLHAALQARIVAAALSQPLDLRTPVLPGEAWSHAENAAQHAHRAYLAQLAAEWPVDRWQDALIAIAQLGAREGAWELVEAVVEGLHGGPGSVQWWEAVLHVEQLWKWDMEYGDAHAEVSSRAKGPAELPAVAAD